jgi:hypothetical protein
MSQKSRAVETHRYTYNYRPGPLPFDGLFTGPERRARFPPDASYRRAPIRDVMRTGKMYGYQFLRLYHMPLGIVFSLVTH